jgi:hypothetical protein
MREGWPPFSRNLFPLRYCQRHADFSTERFTDILRALNTADPRVSGCPFRYVHMLFPETCDLPPSPPAITPKHWV